MNAKELVEYLDGAGLVITDDDLIVGELASLGFSPNHNVDVVANMREGYKSILDRLGTSPMQDDELAELCRKMLDLSWNNLGESS